MSTKATPTWFRIPRPDWATKEDDLVVDTFDLVMAGIDARVVYINSYYARRHQGMSPRDALLDMGAEISDRLERLENDTPK